MTKQILLAAASVVALATAGAANASDITGLTFAGVAQPDAATTYDIGDVAQATGDRYLGDLAFTIDYDNDLPTGNNLLVRVELGGGASFNEAIEADDLAGFDQTTISTGGGVGQNFVEFLVSAAPATPVNSADFGAAAGDPLTIRFTAGAEPTLTVTTRTEAGNTPIEGGASSFPSGVASPAEVTTIPLVDYAPIVDIDINDNFDAVLSLTSDPIFTEFSSASISSTQHILGDASVTLNTVFLPGAGGVLGPVAVTDGVIEDVSIDVAGFTSDDLEVSAVDGGLSPYAYGGTLPTTAQIYAEIVDNENSLPGSDYSVTVTVAFDDYADIVETGDVSSIVRDGVSAEIPWVASAALAARNSTNNVIRVANSSDEPAVVYAEVVTSTAAQGITPSGVATNPVEVGTAPAGGDLQLNTAALTAALGEFVRGNILLTIEADGDDITVNNRIAYSDGKVEETSVVPR